MTTTSTKPTTQQVRDSFEAERVAQEAIVDAAYVVWKQARVEPKGESPEAIEAHREGHKLAYTRLMGAMNSLVEVTRDVERLNAKLVAESIAEAEKAAAAAAPAPTAKKAPRKVAA